MTQPESVPELSTAVVDTRVDPTVTRIGVVAAIVEATDITVKISGSDVLIRAAYLFPAYQPLLGDRVVVQRQGAAWFVLGTLSGPINTVLANPSFELGTIGTLPPSWTIQVISSGGGVPTLTTVAGNTVQGIRVADFGSDSVAAGTSEAYALSAPVPTVAGTHWTAGFFFTAFLPGAPPLFSDIFLYIQFLDGALGILSDIQVAAPPSFTFDQLVPFYVRLSTILHPAGYVTAPPGTAFVRLKVRCIFDLPAASFASFFLDYMILRQV